jgi:hypothetical protein
MSSRYVLIIVESDKLKALPTVYESEAQAADALGWNLKMRDTVGWVMSFPEPREIAND